MLASENINRKLIVLLIVKKYFINKSSNQI
jgi:hypothetical protein